MQVTNEIYPGNREPIQAMLDQGPPGQIFMVNLLKFKERAAYADGRACDLSGRDAYMIYGCAVAVHREAGLKGQLNIETVMPQAALAAFSELTKPRP